MNRLWISATCAALVWGTVQSPTWADEERVWKGTWNNRRFKTSGGLQCNATEGENGEWSAVFSGEFQGQPFKYEVTFTGKKEKKNQMALSGTATVDGAKYEWIGAIKGKTLTGEYRGANGFNGSFSLQEGKGKGK